MTSFYETQPWLHTIRYGRADLTIHALVRDAYKVACLIEDCGASIELTRASCAPFQLTEDLSDYIASQPLKVSYHLDLQELKKSLNEPNEEIRGISEIQLAL